MEMGPWCFSEAHTGGSNCIIYAVNFPVFVEFVLFFSFPFVEIISRKPSPAETHKTQK